MARRVERGQAATSEGDAGVWDNLVLTWRLYRDPRVSSWMKRLPVVLAVLYVIVPFDLIPDVFLGVGQLDDLGVMGLMALSLTWLPRFAPAEVVAEYRQPEKRHRRGHDEGQPEAKHRTRTKNDRGQVIDPPFSVR